ncbi:MAG: SDR family oxidoreductase [Clostridiales Family XIII bacterium]|jgi:NAD(P)-dependent dehydrogenase (short-subunit alcohol dehydrogenase family)|nr:SDR family oxidoreductase [Clostridiales Family XIII bacterium]
MAYNFEGKVALITGTASGIGLTAAACFAKNGAAVAAVDIAPSPAAVRAATDAGGVAASFICNIADEAQVRQLIGDVVLKFGKIDFAFNCAGIGPDGVRIPYTPLAETDAADWQKVVDINLTGTFLLLKYELAQMQKQGYGSIVNTGSTGGYRFPPGFHAYAPTKAGVVALTELASNENAGKGIRVNAVCPGPTYGTQLMDNSIASGDDVEETMKNIIPTGRLNAMEDVVEAVMWLSSDLARQTTGQSLFVDGGMHAKP